MNRYIYYFLVIFFMQVFLYGLPVTRDRQCEETGEGYTLLAQLNSCEVSPSCMSQNYYSASGTVCWQWSFVLRDSCRWKRALLTSWWLFWQIRSCCLIPNWKKKLWHLCRLLKQFVQKHITGAKNNVVGMLRFFNNQEHRYWQRVIRLTRNESQRLFFIRHFNTEKKKKSVALVDKVLK